MTIPGKLYKKRQWPNIKARAKAVSLLEMSASKREASRKRVKRYTRLIR